MLKSITNLGIRKIDEGTLYEDARKLLSAIIVRIFRCAAAAIIYIFQ